jgi:hypothetical protein
MNSMKYKKPKVRFRAPNISPGQYDDLTGPEFDDLCEKVAHDNREWMRQNMPDIHTQWIIVVNGRVVEESHSDVLPSAYEVTRRSKGNNLAFLLTRPKRQYLGLELYFQTSESQAVVQLLGRDLDEVEPYLQEVEGISHIDAQSGSLVKLVNQFALGRMRYECPLLNGEEEKRHFQGAYSATITHPSFEKKVRMTSQSQAEVNARGIETLAQKQPDRWLRVERLHRFDDAVVDMFDTYARKKQESWPALILYRDSSKPGP